jgi:hypothetical protein
MFKLIYIYVSLFVFLFLSPTKRTVLVTNPVALYR